MKILVQRSWVHLQSQKSEHSSSTQRKECVQLRGDSGVVYQDVCRSREAK